MTRHAAAPATAQSRVEMRRARILEAVRRPAAAAGAGAAPLGEEQRAFLLEEAEALYWDELSWEELTHEERVAGGPLTEMVFPGLLALVDGLLLDEVPADAAGPARPHPDAVEEILRFLGARFAALTAELEAGADSAPLVWARAMTGQLIDLVLFRLYGVSTREQEELDALE